MNEINFDSLWRRVVAQSLVAAHGLHGPAHWKRVERNGSVLAERTGANLTVVRLFALFHDSRREDDGSDDGHGARGADFAASLRGEGAFLLSDEDFTRLHHACVWHTDGLHHNDPTIGTCWDADRSRSGAGGARSQCPLYEHRFRP